MPERYAFEDNIATAMLYDEASDRYLFKTNLYQVIFTESTGNRR